MKTYAALPMMFEANSGQTDPRVKFLARAPGYTLFLTDKEAVLSLPAGSPAPASPHQHEASPGSRRVQSPGAPKSARVVRLKFAGASTPTAITGRDQLPGKANYFIGNDPKQWHTNVPNYEAVEYRSVYPGVDAVFHGDNQRLEFDFNVAPRADPGVIALEVQGARRIHLNRAGDVLVRLDTARDAVLGKPRVYQQLPEGRREIAGNFVLRGPNRIAFSIGRYDHSLPLVIDPTLVYSTYLGGGNIYPNSAANDTGKALAVDSTGNVYVTGATASTDFPVTAGAFESAYPYDIAGFVTKLNPSGSALIYSTYFGNSYPGNTTITGIAVDAAGDAYLTGNTDYDFPTTPGAFQSSETNLYGSYAFATELNPAGTGLVYSTFLGGTETTGNVTTYAFGIAVDASDNAYVVGTTTSPTYPTTPGAYQTSQNCTFPYLGTCTTAFVTKVSAGGSSLSYSTYLGTGTNRANAVAVDSLGDAFVVGSTYASTFPVTPGAFQTTSSEVAAFVTGLNPSGTALVYSTFLSGTTSATGDAALAVAVDASGYAYVTGQVRDSDFPTTPGAYQRNLLDYADAFVTKLNLTGSALVYSTYLPGLTTGYGIGVNSSGEAYVAGDNDGYENTFPTTPDAFQVSPPTTTTNGFLTVFNSTGSGLVYSTYIGGPVGNLITDAYGIALDSSGSAYITGMAEPGFPTTPGAFKTTLTANTNYLYPQNAFIMKFAFPAAPLSISPTTLAAGTAGLSYGPVILTATGGTGTVTFAVTAGAPPPGLTLTSAGLLSGTPTQTGTFPFTVTATDSIGDTASQAYTLTIGGACSTITVGPSTLASGTSGTAYPAVTFTESGGVGTTTLSESGALPTGMSFVAGVLSGTPTQTGSFPFTVTATDSNGCTGSVSVTLTVVQHSTATTTTITSTASSFKGFALPTNVALVGNPVTVNFKVQPASGSASATGTVTASDGFNPPDSCPGA